MDGKSFVKMYKEICDWNQAYQSVIFVKLGGDISKDTKAMERKKLLSHAKNMC